MQFGVPANFRKTGARRIFKFRAVQNINFPAHVIDNFLRPQVLCDVRQAWAMNAQRAGDLFLREAYFIALLAVLNHQKPTAKALFDNVVAIADRAL